MKFRTEMPDTGGSGGVFVRLKDKESITGVFRGDIYEFFQLWKPGAKPEIVAEGTPKASFRFRLNFIVKENDVYTAKIFENNSSTYKKLAALAGEYELDDVTVKITRDGEGLDTEYSVLPLLKLKVSEAVKAVVLLPLGHQEKKPADDIGF